MADELNRLAKTDFDPHINTDFSAVISDDENGETQTYSLKLVEVNAVGVKDRDVAAYGRESFSLIFEHPDTNRYLQQGLVKLQHDDLGELLLFIVPMGPTESGMHYEVIFT